MWNLIIPAVASIAGAAISSKANRDATKSANKAARRASQQEIEAVNKYIETNWQALAQRTGIYDQVAETGAPGLRFLRQTVANPMRLSDAQRYQLDEARRVTGDQIRAGGWGGSGRTAAAMMGKVENDMTNSFMENNRLAALKAADFLGQTSVNAERDKAAAIGEHSGMHGNAVLSIGKSQAGATRAVGENKANLATGQGQQMGQAIGDIGAAIVNWERKGRYGNATNIDPWRGLRGETVG